MGSIRGPLHRDRQIDEAQIAELAEAAETWAIESSHASAIFDTVHAVPSPP